LLGSKTKIESVPQLIPFQPFW